MIPTIVESPFNGVDGSYAPVNKAYLELCLLDCIRRGESPYASHKMLTDCLDDKRPTDRELGIEAGLAWRRAAAHRVFYIDLGWSTGMHRARDLYDREELSYEIRTLPPAELEKLEELGLQ